MYNIDWLCHQSLKALCFVYRFHFVLVVFFIQSFIHSIWSQCYALVVGVCEWYSWHPIRQQLSWRRWSICASSAFERSFFSLPKNNRYEFTSKRINIFCVDSRHENRLHLPKRNLMVPPLTRKENKFDLAFFATEHSCVQSIVFRLVIFQTEEKWQKMAFTLNPVISIRFFSSCSCLAKGNESYQQIENIERFAHHDVLFPPSASLFSVLIEWIHASTTRIPFCFFLFTWISFAIDTQIFMSSLCLLT